VTSHAIAKRFGVSASAAAASFRATFGISVRHYVTELRVSRGIELVVSGMKVEAAARDVGYQSRKNFYAAVRRVTGATPTSFRSHRTSA
jgi:methylphosphotriester-DNA--protein-cysteine methyltransferase